MMYAVVALLVSGLYNAGAAKPSNMASGAGFWRMLIYGIKGSMLLACSPVLDKFVAVPEQKAQIRLAALMAALGAGAFARFFREENTLAIKAE